MGSGLRMALAAEWTYMSENQEQGRSWRDTSAGCAEPGWRTGHKGVCGGPGVEPGAQEGWYLSTVRKQQDSQKVTLTGWIFFANEVSADQLRELFSGLARHRAVQRRMKKKWTGRPWTQPEQTTFHSFPHEVQEWEERSNGQGQGKPDF